MIKKKKASRERNIIIPAKTLGNFALGITATIITLIIISTVLANHSLVKQRLTPGAMPIPASDAATKKTYVDAGVAPTSNMTIFTANGTWTRPAGVNKVWVTMVAGGGGGGHIWGAYNAGGGGGGQSLIKYPYAVTADVTVVVGKGGVAATSSGVGGTGGTTSFGTLSVSGGLGGTGSGSLLGGTGAGGTMVNFPCARDGLGAGGGGGGNGATPSYPGGGCGAYAGGTSGTTGNDGGGGGASSLGPGGNGGVSGVGSAGGTGGGGGGGGNGGGGAGGAGGDGKVIVEW